MSDASYDVGPRLVGDPLDRSTSVDPMGPREMLTLGNSSSKYGPGGPPVNEGPADEGPADDGPADETNPRA